jgi:hypothetical protein
MVQQEIPIQIQVIMVTTNQVLSWFRGGTIKQQRQCLGVVNGIGQL